MSVTIVATLPSTTSPAATDNTSGNDSDALGFDFASLLFGQLNPLLPEALAGAAKNRDLSVTDAVTTDAASVVAAASVAPQLLGSSTVGSLPDTELTEKSASLASLTRLPTPSAVAKQLNADSKAEPLKAVPDILETSASKDVPAKIAASPLGATLVENESLKDVSADTPTKAAQAPTGNLLVNASNLPNREALPLSTEPLTISAPLRDQGWASEFGQKIVWMATHDKQSALITLNPPKMGPIEVSLSLDKGNAAVSFASASGETRDAIDSAMPRLRDMFASAGIALGQTNVSAESFGRQANGGEGGLGASQWIADRAILTVDSTSSSRGGLFRSQQGNGLIDIFA